MTAALSTAIHRLVAIPERAQVYCAVMLQENGAVAQINILKGELAAAIAGKEAAEEHSARLQQLQEQAAVYKSQVSNPTP